MKRLSAAIALAAIALSLSAETVRVRVMDGELGIPLEGASIGKRGSAARVRSDADGFASLDLEDGFRRTFIVVELPGYRSANVPVREGQGSVDVTLSITDVIEGEGLVVERGVPGKSDEKSGVSVVMDSKDMKTTANFGLVEDVMSSIKTLPGVGFSGGWSAQPSIRGGYPSEMGTVLDDVYVLYPFHWGGAFSIFNPNMVETAKMSHGVFSARYGRAMSGLLEVTTVKPDTGLVRVSGGISTISCDLFAQVPLGEKAGAFFGGKVTYLETLQILNDDILDAEPKLSETMPTMPFIRDFYAKIIYDPSPDLSISLNGFFGSDGVGARVDETEDGVRTQGNFDWLNLMGFAAARVKWMPTEKTLVRFVGAYNNQTMDLDFGETLSGSHAYSQEFMDLYGPLLGGTTTYSLDGVESEGYSRQVLHQGQAKLETDIQISKSGFLTFGTEAVLQLATIKEEFTGWDLIELASGDLSLSELSYTLDADGNRILNSSAYALWSFGGENSALSGEVGARIEHFYLWNDAFDLNTYPVVSPRASANWTPIVNSGVLERLTFSAGVGIFSMFPTHLLAAEEKYEIKDFGIQPDRALFQVIGVEASFPDEWSFRLEAYYKYYLNRLYATMFPNETLGEYDIDVKDDGLGHIAGFDLMLRKKAGRYLDGYLSYSFVYARYKNPTEPTVNENQTAHGDPLDEWYYPSFHRFHTLNLVLNYRPAPGWTISLMGTLATGMPHRQLGESEIYPVIYDGQIIERYRRTSFYSDTLRTELSCPIDLRISYSNYYKNSKVRWEYYIGAEDILVNLYKPKGGTTYDEYTGEEIADSRTADFNIGIPVISVGYKISY